MKRFACIIFVALMLFASCNTKYDILFYQKYNVTATCKINDTYTVEIKRTEELTSLEVLQPNRLKGTAFYTNQNEVYIQKDDLKIPVNRDSLRGICALLSCFDLEEASITTVESENKSSIVTYACKDATYVVTYGQNRLPSFIEINGDTFDYSIEVCTIELK